MPAYWYLYLTSLLHDLWSTFPDTKSAQLLGDLIYEISIPVVVTGLYHTLDRLIMPDRCVEFSFSATQRLCESSRLLEVISLMGVICLEADDLDEL